MPDTTEEAPPEYGADTIRVDPLARPPDYINKEALPDIFKPESDAQVRVHGPAFCELDRGSVGSHSTCGSDERRRGASASGKNRGRPRHKRKRCIWPVLVVLLFLCVGVPLIVHYTKRDKGDIFAYDQALPSTSLAVTTASFTNEDQFYLNFFQLAEGSLQVAMYMKESWKVYTAASDARIGSGIAHIVKEQTSQMMSTSLFYVSAGKLRERRSSNGPGGWGSVTAGEESWSLIDPKAKPVSINDMELAAGYSALDNEFDNGTAICPGATEGTAWVFYRPDDNSSLVQEWVWDGTADKWHAGSTFEGIMSGSSLVTLVTPPFPQTRPIPTMRWLYGLGEDGRLLEWYCRDCCVNTTGFWQKSNQTYLLPQSDPSNLSLSGRVLNSIRIIYYRGNRGSISALWSSKRRLPDENESEGTATPGFNGLWDPDQPSQIVGTFIAPRDRFACSDGAAGLKEMRCLQPWPGGRVETINDTTGADMLDVPTAGAV